MQQEEASLRFLSRRQEDIADPTEQNGGLGFPLSEVPGQRALREGPLAGLWVGGPKHLTIPLEAGLFVCSFGVFPKGSW